MAVHWEVRGRVGLATIDRPERRNALDVDHAVLLRERLEAAGDLRALVVTGAGSAFCAGADLGSRFEAGDHEGAGGQRDDESGDAFHDVLQRLLGVVEEHPLPVVAAVNGPALGAGTQLAAACDLRVAATGAVFGIPAVHLGIMIGAGSIERLVRIIGHAHAAELLLTGRRYRAAEAERIGLVHRVVEDALDAALDWAEEISRLAPLSVQGHKRALRVIAAASALDAGAAEEIAELIRGTLGSADLREGVAAFGEKRPPEFEGR